MPNHLFFLFYWNGLNTAWSENTLSVVRPEDEKLFFFQLQYNVSLLRAAGKSACSLMAQQENYEIMNIGCSVSSKKISGDTRNNWVTMMFVTHQRYKCFKKQEHIDTCISAFRELERFGFEFSEFGFAWNHVHFQVNIPKKLFSARCRDYA